MRPERFGRILARYGQAVLVERNGRQETAQAFIQPLFRREEDVPETVTGIGWTDGRVWRYLGRTEAAEGDTVVWQGRRFRVRSGRGWYLGGRLVCWQAVLEEAGA